MKNGLLVGLKMTTSARMVRSILNTRRSVKKHRRPAPAPARSSQRAGSPRRARRNSGSARRGTSAPTSR